MTDTSLTQTVSQWLVDTSPYDIIWIDKQARIVYANASFCNTLMYSKTEVAGLTLYDINPKLTRDKWETHWSIVRKEKRNQFKPHHRKKTGEEKLVEIFALFFSNNGNDLICAIIRDISESIYYRTILERTEESVSIGGWKWNLMDQTVIASDTTLNLLNLSKPEELLPAQIVHRFKHPDEMKRVLRAAISNGTPYDIILQAEVNGSGTKWLRCIGNPETKNGQTKKIYGTYQDVTNQRSQEHLLKLSSQVIDSAQDIIFVWDRAGNLFHYNDAAIRELGFSAEYLDKATIFDLDPGITKDWWSGHFDEIIEQKSFKFEWVATRKDNTRFPVEITANLVPYEGTFLNCAILRNITSRKEREIQLHDALKEIEKLKDQLEIENEYLQEEIKLGNNFEEIIHHSEAYKKVLRQIAQVAPTDSTILITGESGTGKELLARSAHQLSLRKDKPLIKVNCAALPKELIESELFGHKRGAFTGAISDKVGKFELANNGTIFLDEIGELPLDLQPKLLRVLQEGEFDRLGDNHTTKVNIRVITATNRDLEQMMNDGKFRQDLYYRLNVFPIHNIPLRDRKEDIPYLAQFFLEKYSAKSGKSFKRVSTKTINGLEKYHFPGNIRELENIIERAVILESGNTLYPGSWMPQNDTLAPSDKPFLTFEELQKQYILEVLFHTNWRVSGEKGAAKILGLKDKTLFAKMTKLGIKKEHYLKR